MWKEVGGGGGMPSCSGRKQKPRKVKKAQSSLSQPWERNKLVG